MEVNGILWGESLPSGLRSHQTWFGELKWTIEIGHFPMKISVHKGSFIAMFHYQRVCEFLRWKVVI